MEKMEKLEKQIRELKCELEVAKLEKKIEELRAEIRDLKYRQPCYPWRYPYTITWTAKTTDYHIYDDNSSAKESIPEVVVTS